jgi:hypothetical protein
MQKHGFSQKCAVVGFCICEIFIFLPALNPRAIIMLVTLKHIQKLKTQHHPRIEMKRS